MTHTDTYPADQYLAAPAALDDLNLTPNTTDTELEAIRDRLIKEAPTDIHLDPADLLRELKWYRDNPQ